MTDLRNIQTLTARLASLRMAMGDCPYILHADIDLAKELVAMMTPAPAAPPATPSRRYVFPTSGGGEIEVVAPNQGVAYAMAQVERWQMELASQIAKLPQSTQLEGK